MKPPTRPSEAIQVKEMGLERERPSNAARKSVESGFPVCPDNPHGKSCACQDARPPKPFSPVDKVADDYRSAVAERPVTAGGCLVESGLGRLRRLDELSERGLGCGEDIQQRRRGFGRSLNRLANQFIGRLRIVNRPLDGHGALRLGRKLARPLGVAL